MRVGYICFEVPENVSTHMHNVCDIVYEGPGNLAQAVKLLKKKDYLVIPSFLHIGESVGIISRHLASMRERKFWVFSIEENFDSSKKSMEDFAVIAPLIEKRIRLKREELTRIANELEEKLAVFNTRKKKANYNQVYAYRKTVGSSMTMAQVARRFGISARTAQKYMNKKRDELLAAYNKRHPVNWTRAVVS